MITPDIDLPHVRDFAARLNDAPLCYVPVDPPGGARENFCEANVQAVVRKFQGEAVYGWHVSEWPGVYISGRHHVIWKSPDGRLIDATPHGMGFSHVAFVEDSRVRDEFCKVPTVIHGFADDPLIDDVLETARCLEVDLMRSEPHVEQPTPDPQLLSQLQALLEQLVARYGPEPRGGPPPEFVAKMSGGLVPQYSH
jgi:hypothetical protein